MLGGERRARRAGVDAASVMSGAWTVAIGFAGLCIALFLLDRLGVASPLLGLFLVAAAILVVALATLQGRTMTGEAFFHARRAAGAPLTGVSGIADVTGGAFLALYFTLPDGPRALLAPALMAGVAAQAFLFATAFQHAGVATVPGFFAWRAARQTPGLLALPVVMTIGVCLAFAEVDVAVRAGVSLTGYEAPTVLALVLLLALVPIVGGGWQSLVLANIGLALCALMASVGPALLTGLAPGLATAPLLRETQGVAPLVFEASGFLPPGGSGSLPVLLAFAFITFLGAAALPGAIGRFSLQSNALCAINGAGFTVLAQFLLVSAIPLSLALTVAGPGDDGGAADALARTTRQHPALTLLPRAALLFLAFNALAATLLWTCAALVRAVRRSRRRDPGERSMVPTRALAVGFAAILWAFAPDMPLVPADLFLLALALSASGLFAPLVAAAWSSRVPNAMLGLAIVAGPVPVALVLVETVAGEASLSGLRGLVAPGLGLAPAVLAGFTASLGVLAFGWAVGRLRRKAVDAPAARLRDPEEMSA